jgi:cell division transport system permease protein
MLHEHDRRSDRNSEESAGNAASARLMLAWLFPSPAERRLLGAGGLRGATPWVIAIMTFTIVIVGAAGLALANTAALVARDAERRYSVQVPDGGRNLARVMQAVRSAPGVEGAEAIPEAAMRETLEGWLGPAAASADLPVPALINFDLRPGSSLRDVERRVTAAAPGATVAAHRSSLGPLLRSLRELQWLALGLVVLLAAAAGAAVVLAARGALDTHRSTIDVMHGVGATDLQVAHLFQRRIAIGALIGSTAGAAGAGLVLLLLFAGASYAGDLTGGAGLTALDLLLLLLLPLALTVLATWVARTAVLAALRQAL